MYVCAMYAHGRACACLSVCACVRACVCLCRGFGGAARQGEREAGDGEGPGLDISDSGSVHLGCCLLGLFSLLLAQASLAVE